MAERLEQSGATGEASQEDAAAAWRAQRAQKACLHSDKPDGAKVDPSAGKWHPMEATWRVATLPFKIAHNSIAMSWRARTRKSWNAGLDGAVSNLRTYSENSTLSLAMVRRLLPCRPCLRVTRQLLVFASSFCLACLSTGLMPAHCLSSVSIFSNVIFASCIPDNVTRTPCDLGGGLKAWWFMPEQLRHQAEAARFIFYLHPPTSSPNSSAHRALVSQLALDSGAAVLMVDYRRTPEETREDSQADVNKAYRWAVGQPGVSPASMLIMADGLGCALALNLCIELRDEIAAGGDDLLPAGVALLSPWVDLSDGATFGAKVRQAHVSSCSTCCQLPLVQCASTTSTTATTATTTTTTTTTTSSTTTTTLARHVASPCSRCASPCSTCCQPLLYMLPALARHVASPCSTCCQPLLYIL